MKISIIILLSLLLFSVSNAQQIQFVQEDLGACDSTSQIAVTAFIVPSNMVWDSLHWYVSNTIYTKEQKTKAVLGDSLIVCFFYDNPVREVKDTFVVNDTHKLRLLSEIRETTRVLNGRTELLIEDTLLFSATNWAVSSGIRQSSSPTQAVFRGTGSIRVTLTYNSGCTEDISVYIPIEDKPSLVLQQTVLADPLGIAGTLTGRLTDGSLISTVNGNVVDNNRFSLQLNAGVQAVTVLSGTFSWTENYYVESAPVPNYRIEQMHDARWCDGSQAIVMITTDRSVIDIVSHSIVETIGNDTAYITTTGGAHFFSVQSGSYNVELFIEVNTEESPGDFVFIEDIIEPTCSNSNDAELVISYPNIMQSILANGVAITLQDTIRNLPEGSNTLVFTDTRLCDFTQNVEIPTSGNPCFYSSIFFSPNADGYNDIWSPTAVTGSQVDFEVYSYRNLNMQTIAKRSVYSGNNSWDGTDLSSGSVAQPGYYIIIGTINYPTELNWPVAPFREVVKLAR